MNVRSRRRWRLSNVKPSLSSLVILVVLLLTLPRLGSWVMQRFSPQSQPTSTEFETAYQAVRTLNGKASGYGSALGSFNSYGISQLDYDTWRQLNGKPVKDLEDIQEKEIKAIYQTQWQSGDCEQYTAPLDVACLDSMISFGVQQGRGLLVNLPDDPKQAALEVANRREQLRRQRIRPPITPGKQLALREGLKRDRALTEWITASVSQPKPKLRLPFGNADSKPSGALSADEIYTKIKPSTVEIWNNSQRGIATTATGIVLTADGLILTNYHVVESNPTPSAKLPDGRTFDGTVTSVDPNLDLALIQLKGAKQLPTTPFSSDSSRAKVGDTVYAIGSPRGESWTMSTAEIIELNSTCANGTSPLRCIRTPSGFLHPGNSGGPLIDATGQVIGINRAVQQSTGEGVSIPVETIKSFLDRRMGQPAHMGQPPRWL